MTTGTRSRHDPPTRPPGPRGGRSVPTRRLAPPAPPNPHGFLRRLRRRSVAAAVVGFGAFFTLATLNVVGVTAHASAVGSGATAGAAAPAGLPAGDFFGAPGVPIQGSSGSQTVVAAPPPLSGGGGGAMLSSGGS